MLPAKFKKATCFECEEFLKYDSKKQSFNCPKCGNVYTLSEYETIFDHEEKMHAALMEDLEMPEDEFLSKKDNEYDLY